jgi:DNA-directed RNA polymerase subunit H (RpoH/RPB5)
MDVKVVKVSAKSASKSVTYVKELDISKHEIVPHHVVLNDKETKEILGKYNITLNQLPRILTSDPMVKKLDAKVRDVIKITRNSRTAGSVSYYRVVVKGTFK